MIQHTHYSKIGNGVRCRIYREEGKSGYTAEVYDYSTDSTHTYTFNVLENAMFFAIRLTGVNE